MSAARGRPRGSQAAVRPSPDSGGHPQVVRPQGGPQELFLRTPADIAIIGGSVYGGKTWSLVYEPLRHARVPDFTFACFRRIRPEITRPGGLWDESAKWYPLAGANPKSGALEWHFPSGARGVFAGLQYEDDVNAWKGAQVTLLEFDQLEEFTERQFFYLLSRNRSTCGVRPYVRASCNPDPDSFLATFLAWWIDDTTGYAIPERSGAIRWFVRKGDEIVWSRTVCGPADYARFTDFEGEAKRELGSEYAKSVTFVLARLRDNAIGVKLDPGYEANVRAMGLVDQERLLGSGDTGGNWKIRAAAGLVFNRAWFEVVDNVPDKPERVCRAWDYGATQGAGNWTAGVRMSRVKGVYYVEDVTRGQWSPGKRDEEIVAAARADGRAVKVRIPQDPGAAGKSQVAYHAKMLAGFTLAWAPVSGDKVTRASPLAAQVRAGNVKLVRGAWNEQFLRELHAFPTEGVADDQVDAAADAFGELALGLESAGAKMLPI